MAKEPAPLCPRLVEVVGSQHPGVEVLMSFPDQWRWVETIQRDHRPLYIASLPPSQEITSGDHFYGLPPHINHALDTYRLYKAFEPRPIQRFEVAWNSRQGQVHLTSDLPTQLHLHPVGQAQTWTGDTEGVLWECFFSPRYRPDGWQQELTQFWQSVEREMQVTRIFTQPREPTFPEGYPDFLHRLGYAPHPRLPHWWSKVR